MSPPGWRSPTFSLGCQVCAAQVIQSAHGYLKCCPYRGGAASYPLQSSGLCQGREVLHSGSLCVSLAGVTNGFGKHTESGSDSECSLGLSGGLAFEAGR